MTPSGTDDTEETKRLVRLLFLVLVISSSSSERSSEKGLRLHPRSGLSCSRLLRGKFCDDATGDDCGPNENVPRFRRLASVNALMVTKAVWGQG